LQRTVDPLESLIPSEQGDRLEDAGRNGLSGQRDTHGLKHLTGLGSPFFHDFA
jgi:hypothetical protein